MKAKSKFRLYCLCNMHACSWYYNTEKGVNQRLMALFSPDCLTRTRTCSPQLNLGDGRWQTLEVRDGKVVVPIRLRAKVGSLAGDYLFFATMPEVGKRVQVYGLEGQYTFPGRQGIKMFVWVDDILYEADGKTIFMVMVHPHDGCE